MVVKIADNILSPLGTTTEENYQAVKSGRTELRLYGDLWGLHEPFVGSLLDRSRIIDDERYTVFERMAIMSATAAIKEAGIDTKRDDVVFVVSTTKGNVALLEYLSNTTPTQLQHNFEKRLGLGSAARTIAQHFGNSNEPIVVSNACTSGLCAQIVAMRLLEQGRYRYAVVIGAEEQSKFIVSGFQSFKALSPTTCRPFDKERQGLNLGEATATIILGREETASGRWILENGAIRNDANHISGPSRTGEGSYQALVAAMGKVDADEVAFVNAHGTATLYNDEMESIAIERAGLCDVPVNSMKGYFGHTMGAAGILESLLSMRAVEEGIVLATKGYEEKGVSGNIRVNGTIDRRERQTFVKMLSGFGGCNAAMLYRKGGRQ